MRRTTLPILLATLALVANGCASSRSRARDGATERGFASWYGPGFHGNRTASGERYDMHALTAAHRTLPFGTVVEVRNLSNDRTVRVKINDRGPFVKNRVLDLSREAASRLDMLGPGTALVEIVAVGLEPIGGFAFTVQLGAFREPDRAAALAERARLDYPEVAVRSDEVWSRVQVGTFASRAEAQRFAAGLLRRGFDAVVVALVRIDGAGLR